ncbi:hydantoinase B/oxoprolinase family protein [Stappia sp. ES.058]|uniref:hydantoinase B/oxoprolinase family protein n=1 Tax=Stappia sp. ES.058 TaxID=1881061 RepID=UPI00087BB833|nr:hydantoinase B/oxoprolinase family protein [Stappia sp. ES.058]SDU42941.1 N-methylhydantoinase B [Stappia sp. ES.058]
MDPIQTTIMNNRFTAIAEEASATLRRTAHTTFVKLVQDYQCAMATPDGDMFAYPTQNGVNVFIGLPLKALIDAIGIENMRPGDCFITNDPFTTKGVVTHLMDVTMLRPVFYDGELVAVTWAFVHCSDIGGAVPGSISPKFTEYFQEGLRVRPMRLIDQGKIVPEIRDIFLYNSRIPDAMWGDFMAMLSALQSMDKRLGELFDRYGVTMIKDGINDAIDFAELKARSIIREIPDGTYYFADYLEGISPGDYYFLNTSMRIEGDSIFFDFSGSDPQMPSSYNFVTGDLTHPYLVQAVVYFLLSKDKDIPRNAGILRPVKVNTPQGTLMNALPPAATGVRTASSTRIYDTIIGCLNQAYEKPVIAAGTGQAGIMVVNDFSPVDGRERVNVINPLCGGGGARNIVDGIDGTDPRFGHLQSVPTEVIEVETVMLVHAYRLVSDSQAAGEYRSGTGIEFVMENTGLPAKMTVRGMNRFNFRPWGVGGGHPGSLGQVILNPGEKTEKNIGKIDVLNLETGDVVQIRTPTGGGFGNPLDRSLDAIASDLKRELLSQSRAEEVYGVVFGPGGEIDREATEENRKRILETPQNKSHSIFDRGPEMDAYRTIWSDEARSWLAKEALKQTFSLRQALLTKVRDDFSGRGEPVELHELKLAFDAQLARLTGSKKLVPATAD